MPIGITWILQNLHIIVTFILQRVRFKASDYKFKSIQYQKAKIFRYDHHSMCGKDSSVGIATGYGLDDLGIESRWGRDFSHLSRPTLGPTQPPVQWVPGFFPGVKSGRGVTLTSNPLLVPLVMK
jgi:hypothetical protein